MGENPYGGARHRSVTVLGMYAQTGEPQNGVSTAHGEALAGRSAHGRKAWARGGTVERELTIFRFTRAAKPHPTIPKKWRKLRSPNLLYPMQSPSRISSVHLNYCGH